MSESDDRLRSKLLAVQAERGESLKVFAAAIMDGEPFRQAFRNFLKGRSRAGDPEPKVARLGKYRSVVEQWLLIHHGFSTKPSAKERLASLARHARFIPPPTSRELFANQLASHELSYVGLWEGRIIAETASGDRIHYPDRGVVNREDYEAFASNLIDEQRSELLDYLDRSEELEANIR